ncbi:unnamed protein product [Cylicocyclus nassatus]|uniref:Mitochondrial import inner membrane translocase subunit Tim21 n=1 Tax=Cylicocyclus nassatus TaxID=53992 RepID=A0AA36H2K1_CYLNA|nr:unnamed protein product [Cylicocyclus nassatus]
MCQDRVTSAKGKNHVFYLTRIAHSSRGGLVTDTCYRPLLTFRFLSNKKDDRTKIVETHEEKQTGLQRSILEEVLIKEKQKPTTFTGKVAEKASNTFLYAAVAAAVGMLGVFVYLLAGEFFAEDSPQKIYSSALALVREDARCQDLFGPKIAGFGEETSRGRRRHVAHHKYEKDGRQRIRVLFHLKGDRDEGIAQAEMEQRNDEGEWTKLVDGNGHFDAPWEPGAHQFVLVKEICDHYDAEMIFQEPCITSDERNWLSKQEKIIIRDAKDTMGVDLTEKNENAVQLVIIIHGLHGLLNEFLRTNWKC